MNNPENDNLHTPDGSEMPAGIDATQPSTSFRDISLEDTVAITPVSDHLDEMEQTIAINTYNPPADSHPSLEKMSSPSGGQVLEEPPLAAEEVDDTAPHKVQASVPPPSPPADEVPTAGKSKQPKRLRVVIMGFFAVLLLGVLGGLVGYRIALTDRQQAMNGQVAVAAATQFQMGLQELAAGQYEMARQRFEYVIQLDPQFPGAAEKLAEVMMKMAEVSTPTVVVTPTFAPTPTRDTRTEDEIFNQAQAFMRAGDWVNALITLDSLRDINLTYKTLQVDGMYYIALRYRGIDKIIKDGNLEGGMYDLALSEQFGPIDKEADGFRTWARLYLTGASFWEVDWERVVFYFSQVYPALPNLRDGSGWTAAERLRIGLINFGDKLFNAGDACRARDQYNQALLIGYNDALIATATQAQLVCAPPTATPVPFTPVPTAAETTEVTPEETPSETPSENPETPPP